jgi:hypothetical protein
MNNLWMEHQMMLVTLSENQNTFISDVHRIDSISGMHDIAIVTWIVETRFDTHATERDKPEDNHPAQDPRGKRCEVER